MTLYSSTDELKRIVAVIAKYTRLPFTNDGMIPGAVLMAIIAEVRDAKVLDTYDFVDVVSEARKVGWQVKSTKEGTPVTWMRAKIPNKDQLIQRSRKSPAGLQALGDAVMEYANAHVRHSLDHYDLDCIGYSRLIMHDDRRVTYFERTLATRKQRQLFNPNDFTWRWSVPKITKKKEQLQALHGTHVASGKKWWAWHGLAENQLHFSGESAWWPDKKSQNTVSISLPDLSHRMTMQDFIELLDR